MKFKFQKQIMSLVVVVIQIFQNNQKIMELLKIIDDSDFGMQNLPREENQDMNNAKVNQNKNESGSYSQTEIPIKLPKSNDHIEYCNPDNDTWEKALVIGRQEIPQVRISTDLILKILIPEIFMALTLTR